MRHHLIFLCVFLVSCSKEVSFFSEERPVEVKPFISKRGPFSEVGKRKKTLRRKRRSYRPARPENPPALNAKVAFVSEVFSSDINRVTDPPPPPQESFLPVTAPDSSSLKPPETPPPPPAPLLKVSSASPPPPPPPPPPSPLVVGFDKKEKEGPPPPEVLPDISSPSPADFQARWERTAPDKIFIPRPLDILFILDTSQSMFQHLTGFKKKFAGFFEYFTDWDWKWMLTNSNHGSNLFFLYNISALKGEAMHLEKKGEVLDLRYLSPDVPGHVQIFLDSVSLHSPGEYERVGYDGHIEDVPPCDLPPGCEGDQEQPLKALRSALVKNQDFFRPEADLAVVVAGNSRERAGSPDRAVQADEVIKQFKKKHGLRKRFKVYGLIIQEGDEHCLSQNLDQQFLFPEGAFSVEIAELSKKTGGKTFSICLPDYRALAESIVHAFSRSVEE